MHWRKVHTDERGELSVFRSHIKEFLLLETKEGHSRGGDFHKSIQHDVVIYGKVLFKFMEDGKVQGSTLTEGQSIVFKVGQPHMFTALEDCLVLEWLEGLFEKTYYPPFRKLVK